jgi:predicted double-glycine peptidase
MHKTFCFFKQETNYTCGAAAMRMALHSCGISKNEKQVAKLLGTNKVRGTWHRYFSVVAEKFKLNYVTKRNSTISDLKKYLSEEYNLVVCYFYPPEKVDHYSVVKKIDKNNIYFWDPFFGEEHKYSLAYFKKVWKSDPKYDNEKAWFFAVKK